jgi:hypothetical protein
MSRSDAEVAGVELVGGTDLGRGRDRRMERGRDEVRVCVGAHGKGVAAEGEICPGVEVRSALSEQTGAARVRRKGSGRTDPSRRTDDL